MKLPAVSPLLRPFHPTLGLLIFCLACAPATPRTAPAAGLAPAPLPAPEGPALLEEGKVVERVLGGGERHEHRVAVEAGWYVRLEIEQVGVNVAASLLGPDGAVLFSADDLDGLVDKEALAVIAPTSGELRLVVTPHDAQASPGAYRVMVVARRPAAPGDAERVAAQRAQAEAERVGGSQEERALREAAGLLQKAARLWNAAGEVREEIRTLKMLGVLQIALFESEAALASLQRALVLSRESGNQEMEALVLSNLAGVASLEDTERLEHYRRALALFEQLGDVREQGRVHYAMGLIYRDRMELDEALRSLSAAYPLRRSTGDRPGELKTLIALALVYLGRGEIEKASESLDQALQLSRSLEMDDEAWVLSSMARFHRHRGELGDALAFLQQAREVYQRTGDAELEARALHNLGTLSLELGDLEGARRSAEQGLQLVLGKSAEGEVNFLNSLGWALYLGGDSTAALASFERALALSRSKNLPAGAAQALGYTGAVYVSLGRAAEGLKLLQEGLTLRRKSGERLAEARSLLEISRAWQALGDLDQAAAAVSEALDLGRRIANTDLQAACLYQWAVVDRQRGDARRALDRVEQALQIIESVRSRVSSEKLRVTFLAAKRAWYELNIDLLLRLEEEEPGRGHVVAALEVSERARSRGLLDLITEGRRIDLQEGIAPELKRKETELGVRLSLLQERLDEVLRRDPESGLAGSLGAQLDEIGEQMERLGEEIRRQHPRYAEIRYPTPLRLQQIQGLLDDRTALLEYFVGREGSYLFVVTRDGLSAHRLPGQEVLAHKVQGLRRSLERAGPLTIGRFRIDAGDLYQVLLGPAHARLRQRPNLLISPDGPLSLIPFEALLTDRTVGRSYRDLAYLLREHSISYVPSASVLDGLRELRSPPPAGAPEPRELVAFGDPIYPGAQVASVPVRAASLSPRTVPALPGSRIEVEAIASLYPAAASELYLGERATEENVTANPLLRTARRIHFATHGILDEARPQLSGLMLTHDASSPGDGVLRVFEIFNLHLNADLVVLSACQTGLGEQVTGEGMIGLTRAFLYAGAQSLLVSLWPVSDRSTPDLMTSFYGHLRDSSTKAEALGRAKLERIEAGDEPYRWAPFILGGDPH